MPASATRLSLATAVLAAVLFAAPASSEQGKGPARPAGGSSKIIQKGSDPLEQKGFNPKAGTAAPGIVSPRDPASGKR